MFQADRMLQSKDLRMLLPASSAAVLAAICFSSLGCSFFPESSFELSPDSRLPRWFTLPPDLPRSDISVTMDYYIDSSGQTAKFTLLNRKTGARMDKVEGKLKGPQPLTLSNSQPGGPSGYPSYEVITARGITEVIEHRRAEPIFYIDDDAAVRSQLGVATADADLGRPAKKH